MKNKNRMTYPSVEFLTAQLVDTDGKSKRDRVRDMQVGSRLVSIEIVQICVSVDDTLGDSADLPTLFHGKLI